VPEGVPDGGGAQNLSVEKGEQVLFDEHPLFFYLTNDTSLSATEIVLFANQRCDQEKRHRAVVVKQTCSPFSTLRFLRTTTIRYPSGTCRLVDKLGHLLAFEADVFVLAFPHESAL